jgi:hypothetical protein
MNAEEVERKRKPIWYYLGLIFYGTTFIIALHGIISSILSDEADVLYPFAFVFLFLGMMTTYLLDKKEKKIGGEMNGK